MEGSGSLPQAASSGNDPAPSTMQQLPSEAAAAVGGQFPGDNGNLALLSLNAVQPPDVAALPSTSTLGPVDERESLHAAVLGLACTTREEDSGQGLKPRVRF